MALKVLVNLLFPTFLKLGLPYLGFHLIDQFTMVIITFVCYNVYLLTDDFCGIFLNRCHIYPRIVLSLANERTPKRFVRFDDDG